MVPGVGGDIGNWEDRNKKKSWDYNCLVFWSGFKLRIYELKVKF